MAECCFVVGGVQKRAEHKSKANSFQRPTLELSWSGKRLEDDRKLVELPALLGAGATLDGAVFRGRFAVTVEDTMCDIEDRLDVCEWWTLDHLKSEYQSKRKRPILANAKWQLMPAAVEDEYVKGREEGGDALRTADCRCHARADVCCGARRAPRFGRCSDDDKSMSDKKAVILNGVDTLYAQKVTEDSRIDFSVFTPPLPTALIPAES